MDSLKKKSHEIKRLGIIAGGGALPGKLVQACETAGIKVFIIAFEGQTDEAILDGQKYMLTRLGAAGQIINTLKSHNIHDLVLIGSIRRPSLSELKPDMRTAQFFTKLGLRALGDNGILHALHHELEDEGFIVYGVQHFVADLIATEGPVGSYKPGKEQLADIERGIEACRKLGAMDIGQSVIVQQGIVLGVEAAEGTDELIRRCKDLHRKGRGGVLVKTCKPQQDKDLDLPTIGPETVRLCADAGLTGIAIHAGNSLLLQPQEVAELANRHKMFVVGVTLPEAGHDD
jgi:UDP-2,3-diacylglucosamine hydrolase